MGRVGWGDESDETVYNKHQETNLNYGAAVPACVDDGAEDRVLLFDCARGLSKQMARPQRLLLPSRLSRTWPSSGRPC